MRWQGRRQSSNIEDRRGAGGGGGGFDGGFTRTRIPMGGGVTRAGGGGIIGILVILGICWFLGINPLALLGSGGDVPAGSRTTQTQSSTPAANDEGRQFVATVLADTEDTWTRVFQEHGERYTPPTLVLFTGSTSSACGFASAATGPFYCPSDQKVYIDLAFYDELRQRFASPGDFAQAYVLAHEVGHHVQNLMGTLSQVNAERARSSQARSNELSVRIELQADCYAGVWANRTEQRSQGWMEQGDIDEALNAATQIGDDMLQRQSQGYVVPDSFTHGSSQQRSSWFKRGFQSGDVNACDTFSGNI